MRLQDPKLKMAVARRGEVYEIRVTAAAFAKFVALDLREDEAIFSDNFFDLNAGQTRIITVAQKEVSAQELEKQLVVRSLFDSY